VEKQGMAETLTDTFGNTAKADMRRAPYTASSSLVSRAKPM
jgi:hypothetical protein